MATKRTKQRNRRVLLGAAGAAAIAGAVWYFHAKNFQVLNPAGMVAVKQRGLFIFTVVLSLLVVIPVYIMTFMFAWKYRESNTKATYSPEMSGSRWAEGLWWGIPTAIILILSIVTWQTSHALDPRKKLDVAAEPMTIQVVALDWKWLFIYPEENVATVNYLKLPVGTPVTFQVTADAPMNAFWIPRLGSQVYAMTGMSMQLNLIADKAGEYDGFSSNISGKGFADMHFKASAVPMDQFHAWVDNLPTQGPPLTDGDYAKLRQPSIPKTVSFYSSVEPGLYDTIVSKYMGPQ